MPAATVPFRDGDAAEEDGVQDGKAALRGRKRRNRQKEKGTDWISAFEYPGRESNVY